MLIYGLILIKVKRMAINMKRITALIQKLSIPLGFGYWEINIRKSKKELGGNLATILADSYNKTLDMTLSKELEKVKQEQITNIVIHELIHAKIALLNDKVDKYRESEEEFTVNDIVHCIEEMEIKR